VVAAAHLLERNPDPSIDEIREELSGNLCRCTGYAKIVAAVRMAAERALVERPVRDSAPVEGAWRGREAPPSAGGDRPG
jgi:xanthine dehydrogenase iron-sulfur cluster and FAD-binding subunit A